MASYKITVETPSEGITMFRVGFADPAQNDVIVKDAQKALDEIKPAGGALALVNGPASLPVAFVLAHGLGHKFGAVACFDPKMGGYVVSISHDPDRPLGEIIKL